MTRPVAYLVTGGGGMLATALVQLAEVRGLSLSAYTRRELDITDGATVREAVAAFSGRAAVHGVRPILVNAAAYTDVEAAEDDPDSAYRVNETGARLVAAAARDEGVGLVHVSSDFVFDGEKEGAYREDDSPGPISVYGASKLAGERAVLAEHPQALLVRTAWVFGPAGRNFPLKILEAAREGRSLRVVTDEVGAPTYTIDLAAGILGLVAAGATGTYHLTGGGRCSRYELALETLRSAGLEVPVVPVTADALAGKARRPRNSVLDCAKAAALGVRLPPWQDGLGRFVTRSTADGADGARLRPSSD